MFERKSRLQVSPACRTFATLLKGSGEDVKTTQADAPREQQINAGRVRTSSNAREARSAPVEMIRPAVETGSVPLFSRAEEAESVSA